jgi:hypothetical protein
VERASRAMRINTPALTENFLPVEIPGGMESNRLERIKIAGMNAEGVLIGESRAQS